MSTIITVASQKGGVGKTTTALNLAFSLSRLSERVLVLDLDPQGSLAAAANLRKRTSRGLVELARGEARLDDVLVPTRDGTMVIGSLGAATPRDVLEVEDWARSGKLGELVRDLARPYSTTIVDAPSGAGAVVEDLLAVSDAVIVPMPPRTLSLRALSGFLRTVQHVRERNPGLRVAGVVVTMYDGESRADRRALGELQTALPDDILFRTEIPRDDLFEEASVRATPVALVPGGQRLGGMFLQLALEVRERTQIWETTDVETEDLF